MCGWGGESGVGGEDIGPEWGGRGREEWCWRSMACRHGFGADRMSWAARTV